MLHVHEDSATALGKLALHEPAKALFEHYDVDRDGKIDMTELRRMLQELDLDGMDISAELLDRFLIKEFARLGAHETGKLGLDDFTTYVTDMTSLWVVQKIERMPRGCRLMQ